MKTVKKAPKPSAADFSAALARCREAEELLDACDSNTTDEAEKFAVQADRSARGVMLELLDRLGDGLQEPIAVSLSDGTTVVYTPEGDGLGICPPERVQRW